MLQIQGQKGSQIAYIGRSFIVKGRGKEESTLLLTNYEQNALLLIKAEILTTKEKAESFVGSAF